MKRTILCMLLLVSASMVQAQFIELKEAKVEYYPGLEKGTDNSYSYLVKEEHSQDFAMDAIGFMKDNFDIHSFFKATGWDSSDDCRITFESSKGVLYADFTGKGELKGTRQKFRNILVPDEVRKDLYRNYQGWTMVGNRYTASGDGDVIERELYRVKLKNGKQSQVVKIVPQRLGGTTVASK